MQGTEGANQQAKGHEARPEAEPALRSLEGELLLLITERGPRTPLMVMVSTALLALVVTPYVPAGYPAAWWMLVTAVTLAQAYLLGQLRADARRSDAQKLKRAGAIYWGHGVLLASMFVFFPFVSVTVAALITIHAVAACAVTLSTTVGYRPIFVPYALITLTPIAPMWLMTPSIAASAFERGVFVAMTLAYMMGMIGRSAVAFRTFAESYAIRQWRVELTQQLREALRHAEAANRAKTRFLAAASHDLRQPIHALSLFSGSLQLRALDARTAAIAEQIDRTVQSLASQFDALLDVSRLDAGVIERTLAVVNLAPLFAELAAEFAPQAERKGLRLSVDSAADAAVLTDALLFQRILRNLLSNAIKYTNTGVVSLGAERVGAVVRVSVRDTGPGIPPLERERIFEEFYQLNNPERDRSQGLGLGLAIVRRLTALLELELRLESELGKGSAFMLELPVATWNASAGVGDVAQAIGGVRPIEVLVVDDEEAIRAGMQTALEEMGFRVQLAASTEAALELARRCPPAIVLADFRLRGEDSGLRAIQALRGVWPQLPALLISGDTAPDRLREAHVAGIPLLHKPVSASALRTSIVETMRD